jgi:hypothetical protein
MDKLKDNNFIKLLKKYTDIDDEFINTFFKKFKIDNELNFYIKDVDIAKYLGISLITLRKRLSTNKIFIENVDFIKVKTGITSGFNYMCNYQCFEKVALLSDSAKSEEIRMYFVKITQFIIENQKLIYQAMENKNIKN